MKRFIFLTYILFLSVSAVAQYQLGDELLFSQFEKGLIKFRDRTQTEAILNYNTIDQEFLFLQGDSLIIKALADPQYIDTIKIGRRYFIHIEKDMFYELINEGNSSLFIQWKSKYIPQGRKLGYGMYSSAAAITNVGVHRGAGGVMGGGVGIHSRFSLDEKFKANTDCIYYIKEENGSYKKFTSVKSLTKIFKKHKNEIESFAGEHKTDFKEPDQVFKLVEYINTL